MSSSHYIRTIHTSFTAAHPSPWARNTPLLSSPAHHHQPLYTSPSPPQPKSLPPQAPMHHNHNLGTMSTNTAPAPASGAGGRRRAYAFRVPSPSAYAPAPGSKPKFDPFADEPTSPVPSIAHLAALSAPPAPRLAAASLPPPPIRHHQRGGAVPPRRGPVQQGYPGAQQGFYTAAHGPSYYTTTNAPRRSGFPGQRSRSPAPSFVLDGADARSYASNGPTEVWRSTSPGPRRVQHYNDEFEYDLGVPVGGGNGGLMEPITSRRVAPPPPQVRVSGPSPRRSPSPPSPAQVLARRSPSPPQQQPSPSTARVAVRSPSPPAPVLQRQQKSAAQLQAERDTRAKLVAGILLNRIHVQRKTGRRVPSPVGGKRAYVPSGLSRVVAVA